LTRDREGVSEEEKRGKGRIPRQDLASRILTEAPGRGDIFSEGVELE